jgi:hypothetical protein
MVDHIYGRFDLLKGKSRPHMFVNELRLYVEYLREETERVRLRLSNQTHEYLEEYKANLTKGIEYYKAQADALLQRGRESFEEQLDGLKAEIDAIRLAPALKRVRAGRESLQEAVQLVLQAKGEPA